MVIRRSHETRTIIWPHYFDRRVSRSDGRRVPVRISVEKPNLDRIVAAAEAAGLRFEIEENASHPFHWWEKSGRILVMSEEPKTKLVKIISQYLREAQREESDSPAKEE